MHTLCNSTMALDEFLDVFGEGVAEATRQAYPPKVTEVQSLPPLVRAPIGQQGIAACALAHAVQESGSGMAICDMGCGKTWISLAACAKLNSQRTLILCPPHLVEKWAREVEGTVPGARTRVVSSISDFRRVVKEPQGDRPLYVILSREMAKLSHGWRAACVTRVRPLKVQDDEGNETRLMIARQHCPRCGAVQETEKEGVLDYAYFERAQRKCVSCAEPLYQADKDGVRRFALAHFIAKKTPAFFDALILDEIHQFKGKGSAQGIAASALAHAIPRVIGLTGTLFGGYASSIFYLLQRFSPSIREDFTYTEEVNFVKEYGIVERVTTDTPEDEKVGTHSKRMKTSTQTRERPGVSPALLRYILGNSVFLRLPDVAKALPPYEESVRLITMSAPQERAYGVLEDELVEALKESLRRGSKRLLGAYLTALLHYPDAPYKGEKVRDPKTDEVIATGETLCAGLHYPKEQELLTLCREEKEAGRGVMVYVKGMIKRDITGRLSDLLGGAGLRVAVLKSNEVKASKREAWIAARVKEGCHVVIANPKAVETGLDLLDFPTIVFYQTEYSVYTLRQASRRSLRLGQKKAVKVVHFAYENTIQHQAIQLCAAKAQASLALEGELVDSGLTELAERDLLTVLAKKLAAGERAQGGVTMRQNAADDPLSLMPEVLPVKVVPRFPLVTGGGAAIAYTHDAMTIKEGRKERIVPAGTGLLFPELMGAA